MTISRDNASAYLHTQFSALALATGQTASDDGATGYGPDIDRALRDLGVTESDLAAATVEDGSRNTYYALVEYYTALRLWRQLGNRVNHTMNQTRIDYDGQRKQAKEMMEAAQRRLGALGVDVTGSGWSIGNLNLDWIENETSGA